MEGSLGLRNAVDFEVEIESCERILANSHINHKVFSICFLFSFHFFTTVMHIISITDFLLFCSNSAQKCLILPADCSSQKSLILLEILPTEFIQTYLSL